MRKKISLLLSFVLLMSAFASLNVQAAVTSFTDVSADTKYQPAIITLSKMNLINGYEENGAYSFKPENQITRAEFTAIITRALGAGDIDSGVSAFPDAQDHWARGNIQVACDRGIVKGFEDGTFRPDDNVTYEQAVKMVVCTLGYETPSLMLGGWPNGYLSQASKLGVTSGISGVINEEPTTRGVVAQLIYNALDIDVLEVSTESENSRDAQTFMEKYLKMKKEKGTVVGVYDEVTAQCPTALGLTQMAAIVNNDVIYLDFRNFTANKADISKYLGQRVVLFYQEVVGSDYVLIDIASETTKNDVKEISSDKLKSYESGKIVYYNDNDKEQSLKVDTTDLSVIYNNMLVKDDVENKLTKWFKEDGEDQIYGSVKLTDSGSDGTVNLIDITDYDIYVAAKAPTSSDYKITNKVKLKGETTDQSIILNPDDSSMDFTITLDGKEIQTTAIRANDVVLVALSDDGDKCSVMVTRTTVKGKITSYYEDDQKVVINGKEYELHDRFVAYAAQEGLNIKVGAEVVFYPDYYGRIVYGTVTASQSTSPYAYIINAGEHDDGDGYFINMFVPSSNSTKIYTLKDKVTVDDVSMTAAEAVARLKAESASELEDGTLKHYQDEEKDAWGASSTVVHSGAAQMARVTISNNLVTSVTTVKADESENIGKTVSDVSGLSKYMNIEQLQYKGSNNFEDKLYINANTTIIFVARDRADGQNYAKKTASAFSKDSEYWVEAFNVNSSKVADLVLVYGSISAGQSVNDNTLMAVVAKKGNKVDNDGESTLKLPYYLSAATLTEKLVGTSEYDDLQPGDLFQTGTDRNDDLAGLKLRINYSDIKDMLDEGKAGESDVIYDWTDGKASDQNSKFSYLTATGNSDAKNKKRGELHMYNVIESDVEGKYVRVTRDGFTKDESGEYVLSTDNELKYTCGTDMVILRYDADKKEISPYVKDTETKLTLDDLNGSDVFGTECSKIALFEYYARVRLIVIYE